MNKLAILLTTSLTLLSACSAIKNPVTHQYQLNAFSSEKIASAPTHTTLLITPTEAVNGYQTEQMHYSTQQYSLNNFVKNSWFSPPATMFYPLLIQSIQHSGYFHAISSGSYNSKTDYRLDTQLLKIQQNFITKPSVLELKIKVVLSHVDDNKIIASKIFSQYIQCPEDSPYGGVVAANQASEKLTHDITHFLIHHVRRVST
jgi:cholesterol transport system auxiliary component